MSSAVDEILAKVPVDQIAGELGLAPDEAKPAISEAITSLLAGADANAADPAGAESLSKALADHQENAPDGVIGLDQIDTGDGKKIVRHIFGENTDQVAEALGKTDSAAGKSMMQQLLPILAPIVMAYMAKQVLGGGSGKGAQSSGGGLDITDVLGGVLGGGSGTGAGGALGNILGGLLGGGRR